METKNIQDFLALVEMGSSYAAAKKLFVSQSTLVRHIQSLEEEFGVTLFDRAKNGFVLNERGKIFLPYAERIAMVQNQCYNALHQNDGGKHVLRITAEHKILDLLMNYRKFYPDVKIDYTPSENAEIKLREGLVDVAFISEVDNSDNALVMFPYIDMELLLLVSDKNPLAEKDETTWDEIADEEFICMDTNDIIYRESFERFFNKVNFTPQISMTVPLPIDAVEVVRENMGVMLMHGVAENVTSQSGVKAMRIKPEFRYKVYMCWRNDQRLSVEAQHFISLAKRFKPSHNKEDLSLLDN